MLVSTWISQAALVYNFEAEKKTFSITLAKTNDRRPSAVSVQCVPLAIHTIAQKFFAFIKFDSLFQLPLMERISSKQKLTDCAAKLCHFHPNDFPFFGQRSYN